MPLHTYKPSQWINFIWLVAIAFTMFTAINTYVIFHFRPWFWLTLFYIYKTIEVSVWKYQIFDENICERKGVFNVKREYVQFYRIKSIMIEEPLLLRLVGLSTVKIITSEQFKPNLTLYAVKNGRLIKDTLGMIVENAKKSRGMREADVFQTN